MSESASQTLQTPHPIRVVLVDDHPLVRMSLRLVLCSTEDIAVVGEAEDGEAALRVCMEVQPDVVLMDLRLPRLDGVATIRALQRHALVSPVPHVPRVLVLTAVYDEHLIPEALAAGASGYLLKDGGVDDFIAAVRAVQAG